MAAGFEATPSSWRAAPTPRRASRTRGSAHGLAAARLHGRDLNGLQVIIERDGISNVNHDNVRVLRELDREALALIVVELGLAELGRDADGLGIDGHHGAQQRLEEADEGEGPANLVFLNVLLLLLLLRQEFLRAAGTGQLLSSCSCLVSLFLALVMLNDEFLWIGDRRNRLVIAQSYETQSQILKKPESTWLCLET